MMPLTARSLLLTLVLVAGQDPELSPRQAADIVLDCWYIEEGGGHLASFSGGFTREKARLILRNVSISADEQTSTWTEYEVHEDDKELLIFESLVSDVPLPDGEILLHADCEGLEVTCEIASINPPRQEGEDEEEEEEASGPSYMAGLRIAERSLSVTLVMRSVPITGSGNVKPIVNEKLNVPLSATGTIPVSIEFLVYTSTANIRTTLGRSVLLACGFAGADASEVSVEWRLQHKGKGRRVYTLEEGKAKAEREGTTMELDKMERDRNVSLHLENFSMRDEGTYICTVKAPRAHAQQTVLVEIMEAPSVTLKPEVLHFRQGMRESLVCEVSRYYPLDVSVKWSAGFPGDDDEPTPLSRVSFSSHRRNKDGTYNVSATAEVLPGPEDVGLVYSCEVSHVALQEPVQVALQLEGSTEPADWHEAVHLALPGVLLASILFLLALAHFCGKSRRPTGAGRLRSSIARRSLETPQMHQRDRPSRRGDRELGEAQAPTRACAELQWVPQATRVCADRTLSLEVHPISL
ncbi:tapasin-related protein-like isoform X2 [Heterodontus francisci]|uniref:tapasin-related protein-like isoform X2 n=1 Tax=Heterodontus francisci TaxID=7792 RepID=UPI00355AE2FA